MDNPANNKNQTNPQGVSDSASTPPPSTGPTTPAADPPPSPFSASNTPTDTIYNPDSSTSNLNTPPEPANQPAGNNPPQTNESTNSILPPVTPASGQGGQDGQTQTTGQQSGGGNKRRNVILIALAIFLMLGGIGAGTFLIGRQQLLPTQAWDCTNYVFSVEQNGTVSVANGSTRDEPSQQVDIYVNGELVDTLDVPALDAGEGATLGTVNVPSNGQFSWEADGTKDCRDSGTFDIVVQTAQCLALKAFDEDWELLTANDLSSLDEGDVVRFTVAGTTTSGQITRARFTINGELRDEVTDLRPGTNEFYDEYTIPADTEEFLINAELYHPDAGWF